MRHAITMTRLLALTLTLAVGGRTLAGEPQQQGPVQAQKPTPVQAQKPTPKPEVVVCPPKVGPVQQQQCPVPPKPTTTTTTVVVTVQVIETVQQQCPPKPSPVQQQAPVPPKKYVK
jgi:hypothetical protein